MSNQERLEILESLAGLAPVVKKGLTHIVAHPGVEGPVLDPVSREAHTVHPDNLPAQELFQK